MKRPPSLSDHQIELVQLAAKSLLPSHRHTLEALGRRLGAQPSDDAVCEAIASVLSINRIPAFVGPK